MLPVGRLVSNPLSLWVSPPSAVPGSTRVPYGIGIPLVYIARRASSR